MSSDNDLSNNDVNDSSGNDFVFVHVPNNGLIPATNFNASFITNIGTKDIGADRLITYYYEPIKDTGFYDNRGFDIGHLFATGGGDHTLNYKKGDDNSLKIWHSSDIAGTTYDANSGMNYDTQPEAYSQYFSDRALDYEGEVGPHVQFGGYGAYKWGKSSEGAYGIESAGATWIIPIPSINTLNFKTDDNKAVYGTQRAKKAVAYIVSSGGSCTGSSKYYGRKYSSSDGSSGAYGVGIFDIGNNTEATLHLSRYDRHNTYVTIGGKTCSITNGDGGAQQRWKNTSGKHVHQVGSLSTDYSNITLISRGKNSRKGLNNVDFPNGHPKFNYHTGRGSGDNSDKPGFVGAIQVHFFWD